MYILPSVSVPPGNSLVAEPPARLLPRAKDSSKCDSSNPSCEFPQTTSTLTIVLCTVLPVAAVAILIFVLHRRLIRKQRLEDKNDKLKSLDFGIGPSDHDSIKGSNGTSPTENKRGLSMDMLGNPFLLPPELRTSSESLGSLTRTVHDPNDPYRQVSRVNSPRPHDLVAPKPSHATPSTSGRGDGMNSNLLHHAQDVPESAPPQLLPDTLHELSSNSSPFHGSILAPERAHFAGNPDTIGRAATGSTVLQPEADQSAIDGYTINDYYGNYDDHHQSSSKHSSEAQDSVLHADQLEKFPDYPAGGYTAYKPAASSEAQAASSSESFPPRKQSLSSPEVKVSYHQTMGSVSDYGDTVRSSLASPPVISIDTSPDNGQSGSGQSTRPLGSIPEFSNDALGVRQSRYDMHRLSMGVRPLPRDDPSENPEERANRIRSFYKEYFDESKPEPSGGYPYNRNVYADQYTQEFNGDPAKLDQFGRPRAPYAQPMQRRAMTPPPRAPPRFISRPGTSNRGRSSSSSMGQYANLPPRGMSSLSGRYQPAAPQLPPPKPLSSLPTPGKLTEDSLVFMPIDFAPPLSFRERQAGHRPDSPLGSQRPYSPAGPSHSPLVSSFMELPVLPSPHALRKSGTFTALDFAPPPKIFRNAETASDAGSIRSNNSGRSGMSSTAMFAVRSGANRVSRLPPTVVGTLQDTSKTLRPTWDMRDPM